jgi:hypothetical protein
VLWNWNAASKTHALFVQDNWKANSRLTLTGGVRWDDFGNPYSRSPSTVFGNFILGAGATLREQIASGAVQAKSPVFSSSQKAWSPRLGFAYDVNGKGDWVVRGGAGMFHNWVTPANAQEEFRWTPPGAIEPTFFYYDPVKPIFGLGTTDKPPFGYTMPVLPPRQFDQHGGVPGLTFGIGAINPNLKTPVAYNFTVNVERRLGKDFALVAGYSGSRGNNLMSGGGNQYAVSYGQNINAYAGDLIEHNQLAPTRINSSFGNIAYTNDDRTSSYNSFVAGVRGRFGARGFFSGYYTRSASWDDTQVYPVDITGSRRWGSSVWDTPQRLSLSYSYELPGLKAGKGIEGRLTGGWSVSGTTILQSGLPFLVATYRPFAPITDASGKFIGLASNSGDYNGDGENFDYPNVASYTIPHDRQSYLRGVFTAGQFTQPAMGSQGNQKPFGFRGPGFAQTDVSLAKATRITERMNLQLRFEFYNLFNRVNLNQVDNNMDSGTFGRSTGQGAPRWIQLGANLRF